MYRVIGINTFKKLYKTIVNIIGNVKISIYLQKKTTKAIIEWYWYWHIKQALIMLYSYKVLQ